MNFHILVEPLSDENCTRACLHAANEMCIVQHSILPGLLQEFGLYAFLLLKDTIYSDKFTSTSSLKMCINVRTLRKIKQQYSGRILLVECSPAHLCQRLGIYLMKKYAVALARTCLIHQIDQMSSICKVDFCVDFSSLILLS